MMSGYWANGIVKSESNPAMVVRIAMTIARRGRSTKMAESIGSVPGKRLGRVRSHRYSRAQEGQPIDDNKLAAREAFIDHDTGAALNARLDALDDGFAFLDRKHVDAFLIGDERSL